MAFTDLNIESREALILEAVDKIRKAKLEGPVVFLLEAHRPLGLLAQTGLTISKPLLVFILGALTVNKIEALLQDPEWIDHLIVALDSKNTLEAI